MVEPLIYCEFCRRLIRPKEAGKPGYDIVNRKICCYDCLRDRFPVLFASRMEERRRLKEAANIPPPPPADTEAITAEVPVSGCGDAQADAGAFSATPGRSAQPASDLRAEEKSTGAAGSPAAAGGTGGSDDSGGRYASSGKDRGNAGPGAQSGANGGVAARPAQAAGEMSRPTHGTTGPVSARRRRAVASVLLGATIGTMVAAIALFLAADRGSESRRAGSGTPASSGTGMSGSTGGGDQGGAAGTSSGGGAGSPAASAPGAIPAAAGLHAPAGGATRDAAGTGYISAAGSGSGGTGTAGRGSGWPSGLAAAATQILAEDTGGVANIPAAIARLKEHLAAQPEGGMAVAIAAKIRELKAEQDARTRTLWREAAERILTLAAEGRVADARTVLEELKKNPGEGEWLDREGPAKLAMLEAGIEAAEAGAAGRHPEGAAVRTEALPPGALATGSGPVDGTARPPDQPAASPAAARRLRMEFYDGFDADIAKADPAAAARLARGMDAAAAGMSESEVRAFEEDARAVRTLYEALAATLRASKGREITMSVANAPVTGIVESCDGDTLMLSRGRAMFSVRLSKMKVPELRPLLPRGRHARALYVLGTARGETAETEDNLKAAAAESAEAPWPHLASRLRFRTELAVLNELPARIATIGTLIKSGDFEKASTGLAAVSGAIRALPPESVPEGVRTQVAELEGRLRKVERSRIVLQNGVSPEGFEGIRTDQISAQREDTEISDRGVAWGLKIGSFDDLKRVLIGFEGLEKIAGKETRVRKAVLELYQTDNSAAEGAVVGLFRLKRRWVPNAGTWLCYDQSKKARWQIPGASGATDASREPEATVTFDGKGDLWRSWDITSYVRDVIEGRAPNNGLLLRVIHDEPKYHIRFYPETDLLLRPDPKLRPRLVMDLEKTPEGALP